MGAHQLNLIGIILENRGNGWINKDIANYLNELGYKTSRGREPTAALVERMHTVLASGKATKTLRCVLTKNTLIKCMMKLVNLQE